MDYLSPYALAHPVQSFVVLEQAPILEYGYDEQDLPSGEGGISIEYCVAMCSRQSHCYRLGDLS